MEALLFLAMFPVMAAVVWFIDALHQRWAWRSAVRDVEREMKEDWERVQSDHRVLKRPLPPRPHTVLEERVLAQMQRDGKPCGGGQCRHRADCADRYCPGRLSASLTGAHRP